MTNDEDSGGGKTGSDGGAGAASGEKKGLDGHPNGDAGFSNGSGGVGSAGSGSDEFSDHVPLETDALQPKIVKSKSSNKVKESKEVSRFSTTIVSNEEVILTKFTFEKDLTKIIKRITF